jgi:hypothetical protein
LTRDILNTCKIMPVLSLVHAWGVYLCECVFGERGGLQ